MLMVSQFAASWRGWLSYFSISHLADMLSIPPPGTACLVLLSMDHTAVSGDDQIPVSSSQSA